MKAGSLLRIVMRVFLGIFGILVALVLISMIPWNLPRLSAAPDPAQNYEQALARIETFRSQESPGMNPVCRLQLMSHDKKVEQAIILVHGYTNCPQQFHELGQRFYDLGYNVLIAPLPHHGLADRMTDEQALLTAAELAAFANQNIDIAHGLGERVTMLGISTGGLTTAWAAQNRADLDLAVIISPTFGYKQIPTAFTASVMNVYGLMPDTFVWWDPAKQGNTKPDYAYPRYSQHVLTQFLRLGFIIQSEAKSHAPSARKLVVVFNGNEDSVNNDLTMDVVKMWQKQGANLQVREFDANLNLKHDLIDPNQDGQKIDVVYPQLIEWTTE